MKNQINSKFRKHPSSRYLKEKTGPIKNLKIKEFLPKIKENVPLRNHTTFKIGGPARYFFVATRGEDLIKAIKVAKKLKLPFFVLGGGSNVLVSDNGFYGLVIKMKNLKFEIKNSYLYAQAGLPLQKLVKETTKKGLAGLEWAGGLPGTLGGAIFGNAGAFGGEIKDCIVWVEALNKNLKIKRLMKEKCQFKYRFSIFKRKGWIIISALLRLKKKKDKKIIQSIARLRLQQRRERHPLEYPNAGSIFKNYPVEKAPEKTLEIFREVIKTDPFPVIPAAALIAKIPGLVGKKIGGAQISRKHPNFIVNLGKANAEGVKELINLIKKRVKEKFGLELEEEIQYLGF